MASYRLEPAARHFADRNALVWEPSPTSWKPRLALVRTNRDAGRRSTDEKKVAVGSGAHVIAAPSKKRIRIYVVGFETYQETAALHGPLGGMASELGSPRRQFYRYPCVRLLSIHQGCQG